MDETQQPPKRILVIRMQAMGDVVITLPYVHDLKNQLPNASFDLLTRKEVESIPKESGLFDRVFAIGGRRNTYLIVVLMFFKLPLLWLRKYDVVIDLQNNKISNLLKWFIRPKVWSSFDRFSSKSAGQRNAETIVSTGLTDHINFRKVNLKVPSTDALINQAIPKDENMVIVVNPAGFFKTRNWSLENYRKFCSEWILEKEGKVKFVFVGTDRIKEKAVWLCEEFPHNTINLVNLTSPEQAFRIVQKAHLVLSEDSGLMHMAWVSGTPTLVILGSTRSDWVAHHYPHTLFLSSDDLECGNCMLAECIFGDVRCLTRYSPEFVFEKSKELMAKSQ